MWVLGLIIGAFMGAIGGGVGAFFGAIAGAGCAWAMSKKWDDSDNSRFVRIESTIEYLQERVAALERSALKTSGRQEPHTPQAQPEPEIVKPGEHEAPYPQASEDKPPPAPTEPRPSLDASVNVSEDASMMGSPPTFTSTPVSTPRYQPIESQSSALWNFFFGGNALVRFGVVVLFFGVAFLLKYASEHIEIPIEARLIGVALSAIILLGIGWRLRTRRSGYALIIQGGGIGVLYLTIFAAFRLYQLLPAPLAFALLTAMAIFSSLLAVLQDSRSLAAFGVSGGFLGPILASTDAGSHVALFSFYALLNLGILIIAWFKAWRSLNLLGFVFTFIIGLVWGQRYYRSEYFASTEPFLILLFLFYVAIAVLFVLHQQASVKIPLDGALVFGVPLVGFGLQSALVRNIEYGAAFSALTLGAFYLLLARLLWARSNENVRLLVESFLALGVAFGTLAIPLAFDGRWTAAAWALEGAAIVWIGVRQNRILASGFGVFLQFAAGVAFLPTAVGARGELPVLNSFYLGCLLISIASLFSSWYLKHNHRDSGPLDEHLTQNALFFWGILWWFGGSLAEIHEWIEPVFRLHALLLFVTASCALFSLLSQRIHWQEARHVALALLPFMFIAAFMEFDRVSHPSRYYGFIAWPGAFAVNFWLLWRHDETPFIASWHTAALWLFVALSSWETAWWIGELVQGGEVWRLVGWPLVSIAILAWLTDRGERCAWPVARYLKAYLYHGAIVLAGFIWLWMLHANFSSSGDPSPLPYLPLLNPLDLAQGAALLTLFAWLRRLRVARFAPELFKTAEITYVALGSIGFIWLNGILLRTLHIWTGVPLNLDAMMRSMLVQSAVSIFWSVLALCTMVVATRIRVRPLWLCGAALMALVVAKLFFIDLSNVGGIERIVSFIGVGLLMLIIGYFSPVPPARSEVP